MVKIFKSLSIIIMGCYALNVFCSNQELFVRARQLYANEQYQEALAVYRSIEPPTSSVLYNMGNCSFYIKDYPHAVLYWKRSLRGAWLTDMIAVRSNIASVKAIVSKDTVFVSSVWKDLADWLYMVIAGVSPLLFQCLFLVLLYMVMILPYFKIRKKFRFFVLLPLLLCIASMIVVYYVKESSLGAVVMHDAVAVYTAPDKAFDVIHTVHGSDIVWIIEKRSGWYKIKYCDMIGWIESSLVEII